MASQEKTSASLSSATEFGVWLRSLRESKGAIQRAAAAAADMDSSHLGKVERGERFPTAEQANALARFFGHDEVDMRLRLMAAKIFAECGGDAAMAHAAAGMVQEAAAPYLVDNPVNKRSKKK